MTRRDGLWIVIILCSALLTLAFTPALVSHALVVFVLVSLVCWSAVFGGAAALSRSVSRRGR